MTKIERMTELTALLNKASKAYYQNDEEIMSNYEYDKLYDELVILEQETGTVLAGSPTVSVGYESVDELPKERHESPMLSLDKTKDRNELRDWVKDKEALLSWKLDGLTVVLTYEGGKLAKAVTRGNGEVGEVITANARTFVNIPLAIPYKETLILRGEAVISYSDFEMINESILDPDEKYKNPRNLCSGSVRQLNSEITAKRHVRFFAFSLVSGGSAYDNTSRSLQMKFLKELGFETVEYMSVNSENILDAINSFAEKITDYDIPSDGLVLSYNDLDYSRSLGRTAKFPKDSIAFKWADEIRQTSLLEIEWSPSRTGLINPVAIFESVELEGTTVSRASVHNISVMEDLQLGIGDEITVYKANMIIPQIAENLTRSGIAPIPDKCPCCGGATQIKVLKEAKSLYCINPECPAKQIKKFSHFVSRDAMNVDGLSEATLEKFVDKGYIKTYSDIFRLERYMSEIVMMEGFGEKSYNNLMDSLEKAKDVSIANFLYSLGILNVGLANAKLICRSFGNDFDRIMSASADEFSAIDKIGDVIANSVESYFADENNVAEVKKLLETVRFKAEEEIDESSELAGKTVVVTGSLNMYDSRKDLQKEIELRGGKVAGSVSKNTFVLVNNDINSSSSKNKTAKELGIPIVTEEEFVRTYLD